MDDRALVDFLAKFVFESDAIEGIGPLNSNHKHPDEHLSIMTHLHELARVKSYRLEESDVLYIQRQITLEQHLKPGGPKLKSKYIGHYRDCTVYVGNRLCPPPTSVPLMMKDLIKRINSWQTDWHLKSDEDNVKTIADFHFDYEHIHPFADGNGRSGRALIYYLFRFTDLRPFIFTSHDKRETYYPAFASKELMQEYFLNKGGFTT
jgi:Fic family protein